MVPPTSFAVISPITPKVFTTSGHPPTLLSSHSGVAPSTKGKEYGLSVLPYNLYNLEDNDNYDNNEGMQILTPAVLLRLLQSISPGSNIPVHQREGPCPDQPVPITRGGEEPTSHFMQFNLPDWFNEVYPQILSAKGCLTHNKCIKAACEARTQAAASNSSTSTSIFNNLQPCMEISLNADQLMADVIMPKASVPIVMDPALTSEMEACVIRRNVEGESMLIRSVEEPSDESLVPLTEWICQHPDIHIPEVIMHSNGSIMDEDALLRIYCIAQTGLASGRMMEVIMYLHLVECYLVDYPNDSLLSDSHYNMHYTGDLDSVPDVRAHFAAITTDGALPNSRYDVIYDSQSFHQWVNAWACEVQVHFTNSIN
ncbi:hypothetical protein NM688_g2397 [Phlebia brevispora]|uniref:Uncharacterized protein n=1 Tax=Phlebia brevispora TaxID=194682 RepID=A0ACC1T8T5_9APHY|nr:hypothetical protein NM688_g2397 [Phlebia brevispora]